MSVRKVRTKKKPIKHQPVTCCIRAERRPGHYLHFVQSGVLRTNSKTLGRQYQTGVSMGGVTYDVWPSIPPGELVMLVPGSCSKCGNTDRYNIQTETHLFERTYQNISAGRPDRVLETATFRCLQCKYTWQSSLEVFGDKAVAVDEDLRSRAPARA